MPHEQYNAVPPALKDPDPPEDPEFVLGQTRCHYAHFPGDDRRDLAVVAVTIGDVTLYLCFAHLIRNYSRGDILKAEQLPGPRP